MGHVLTRLGPVPVPRVLGDEYDHARGEVVLLTVGGDEPVAFGAHEDLIGRVRVPAVTRARLEMDLREPKIGTVLASDSRKGLDIAGEDLGDAPGRLPHLGLDHPHARMVARVGQT